MLLTSSSPELSALIQVLKQSVAKKMADLEKRLVRVEENADELEECLSEWREANTRKRKAVNSMLNSLGTEYSKCRHAKRQKLYNQAVTKYERDRLVQILDDGKGPQATPRICCSHSCNS